MQSLSPTATHGLQRLGISSLNPMQEAAYALLSEGHDLVLVAPTGSGKTLAYLLPLIGRLDPLRQGVQAMVVVPTRELGLQVEDVFRKMQTGLKVTCCYGGHKLRTELNSLSEPPALLIGTPGRLIDHLDRGSLDLQDCSTLVLDEYDKSLELGFLAQLEYLVGHLQGLRHRVLISATPLDEVPGFVGLQAHRELSFAGGAVAEDRLEHHWVYAPDADKLTTLLDLLCGLGEASTLVFLNHREAVERVSAYLEAEGVDNAAFHGGLDQFLRERELIRFRNGSCRVLVATDLAARGLDIPALDAVVHYHLPQNEEAYIHRNGRTARMQAEGTAYVILGPDEARPPYMDPRWPEYLPPAGALLPPAPRFSTLFIGKGKKHKVNKVDVVGFLCQQGGLVKEEIGLISVQDDCIYAALPRDKAREVLRRCRNIKIKGKDAGLRLLR